MLAGPAAYARGQDSRRPSRCIRVGCPLRCCHKADLIAPMNSSGLTVLELCAGGGGQALGLEQAGFQNRAAIEIDPDACTTLRRNRPNWTVLEEDIRNIDVTPFAGVDLVAGGVPCPPFSIAGKQLGPDDDRDLFPAALDIVEKLRPRAVMLENVRGFGSKQFDGYRADVFGRLRSMGYEPDGRLLNASDYGVPQLRPRYLIVALQPADFLRFAWPTPIDGTPTVGEQIGDLMASRGWRWACNWAALANGIAPTLVGGSRKHGGPDLGPTRAREQWAKFGVDGLGIAAEPPGPDAPDGHMPKLTVRMAARLQGFPDDWLFAGGKTTSYRQVGNAFPPPVAKAVGMAIKAALDSQPTCELFVAGQHRLLETGIAIGGE